MIILQKMFTTEVEEILLQAEELSESHGLDIYLNTTTGTLYVIIESFHRRLWDIEWGISKKEARRLAEPYVVYISVRQQQDYSQVLPRIQENRRRFIFDLTEKEACKNEYLYHIKDIYTLFATLRIKIGKVLLVLC